jgi:hypothetical protein
MSYRTEIEALILELREQSNALVDNAEREKKHRQAEILDFLINHTKDAIGALDA